MKSILNNPNTSGMALVVATDKLFKGQCFAWEFDTILSELEEEGVTLTPEATDRLLGLMAIKSNPAHLWDVGVFSNLVETLSFNEAFTDTLNECSAGEVCWALEEIEEFGKYYQQDFSKEAYNDDPRIYAAGCVANEGFFVLPPDLEFCKEEYARMHALSKHVSKEQGEKVLGMAAGNILESVDEEDVVQVQIAKLQEVRVYCDYRREELKKELRLLAGY